MKTKEIILDFGSGNTCLNDDDIIKEMYNELKKIDSGKTKITIKWQLFKSAGLNIPLEMDKFDLAYRYGKYLGYNVTASVFDIESLKFLLNYNIPFVKIANNKSLHSLIKHIPKNIDVYISSYKYSYSVDFKRRVTHLWCVSNYPAYRKEYEDLGMLRGDNISDHTTTFELYDIYKPGIIEWHYKLKNTTGLDSGEFARTPEQLKEIM